MHASQLALCVLSASAVVILDQSTKAAAQQLLSDQHRASKAVVRLQVVLNNHGGIGQLAVPRVLAISVGGIAIAIGVAMVAFTGPFSATTLLGLGMSIGGGLSNIGDLALRGRIVDFVAIWRWPTFNLADVAICAGLVLTGIGLR